MSNAAHRVLANGITDITRITQHYLAQKPRSVNLRTETPGISGPFSEVFPVPRARPAGLMWDANLRTAAMLQRRIRIGVHQGPQPVNEKRAGIGIARRIVPHEADNDMVQVQFRNPLPRHFRSAPAAATAKYCGPRDRVPRAPEGRTHRAA